MNGCRPLAGHEIQALLAASDPRERIIILTGLTFGLRISEILSLRFKDVSQDHLMVNSSKESNNITFPIPEEYKSALALLKEHYRGKGFRITPETPLCMSQKGWQKPLSRQHVSWIIGRLCRKNGLSGKVNVHSFRKTYVSRIYEMTGKDLAQTRIYSRHKSMNSLKHYLEVSESADLILSLNWMGEAQRRGQKPERELITIAIPIHQRCSVSVYDFMNDDKKRNSCGKHPGCYVFFADERAVYVGSTVNSAKERAWMHLSGRTRHAVDEHLLKIVSAPGAYIEYYQCEKKQVRILELYLINELKPCLNRQNSFEKPSPELRAVHEEKERRRDEIVRDVCMEVEL